MLETEIVTREVEYEVIDKRENKRMHKKGKMTEETKSEEGEH